MKKAIAVTGALGAVALVGAVLGASWDEDRPSASAHGRDEGVPARAISSGSRIRGPVERPVAPAPLPVDAPEPREARDARACGERMARSFEAALAEGPLPSEMQDPLDRAVVRARALEEDEIARAIELAAFERGEGDLASLALVARPEVARAARERVEMSASEDVRGRALELLAVAGGPEAERASLIVLAERAATDRLVRQALATLPPLASSEARERALPLLLEAARRTDAETRGAAARRLAEIDDPAAACARASLGEGDHEPSPASRAP
jgi:hypothetical protein